MIASILRRAPNYEAEPALVLPAVLAAAGPTPPYNLSLNAGRRLQSGVRLHATINETWCSLAYFSNATATAAAISPFERAGALDADVRVRLVRRGGLAWSGVFLDETESWWGPTAATTSASGSPLAWTAGLDAGTAVGFGLFVDPNYAASYQIDVRWIDLWQDSDRDGISDADEARLGTDPAANDTDGDGTDDWADLRPLDPAVPAVPFGLIQNSSIAATLAVKIVGLKVDGSVSITLNNTLNAAVVPGDMALPRFAGCSGCIAVEGEGRVLSCDGAGVFADPEPVPAFGRRGYLLSPAAGAAWDGLVADLGPESLRFNASVSASEHVDLRRLVASVHPQRTISRFAVASVSQPALFSAALMADGHTLAVSTPAGPNCGDASIALSVTLGGAPLRGPAPGPVELNLTAHKDGGRGPNRFRNPSFAEVSNVSGQVPGWKTNLWNGDFAFEQPPKAGFDGGRCGAIHGLGAAGKFGIYQTVELDAGTFMVSGLAASAELMAGQWSGTSSLYISFGDSRAVFSPVDDTNGTHNLLSGSSGWRAFNASFSLASPANATVYLFMWGPGWFFMDQLAIRELGCAGETEDSLKVGSVIRPLAFDIPMTAEDTLLCGYCNDTAQPKYNGTLLCRKCAAANMTAIRPAPQATSPRTLTNFPVGAKLPFFVPDANTWHRNENSTATLFSNGYMESNPAVISDAAPADWSAYSYLEIEILNPSAEPVDVTLEIRDTATVDCKRPTYPRGPMSPLPVVHVHLPSMVIFVPGSLPILSRGSKPACH